jgi:hypothetical protein
MNKRNQLMRFALLKLAYIFFDRKKSLWFCTLFVLISLIVEKHFHVENLFSCSGAVVTLAGLFLNIKYSLNFHLKLSKIRLFNKLGGAGVFGTSTITKEQEELVDAILADEMFGVSFMILGTLIWAYGSYFIKAVS